MKLRVLCAVGWGAAVEIAAYSLAWLRTDLMIEDVFAVAVTASTVAVGLIMWITEPKQKRGAKTGRKPVRKSCRNREPLNPADVPIITLRKEDWGK